jgi:DNA topoisomerase-2
LFINATIIRPRYSSQTKEDMITEIKNFGTTFEVSDHFIKEIIGSDIVQSILDWAQAKENALMQAELRKLNKNTDKVDPIRVDNFEDASERIDRSKCICFFTEGLSAATAVISARDTKIHATFPLKGKPVNVNGISPKKLMENAEFKNILTITGLKLGEKVTSPRQLRFGKLCFLTDADFDGSHIVGLLINMFHTFWPELFELGMIYRFRTPLIKVTAGKELLEFYDEAEFKKWESKNKNKKFTSKYYKGLGTSTSKDFKGYLENSSKNLIKYVIDDQSDVDSIHLAFSKDAGKTNANNRKNWLALLDE